MSSLTSAHGKTAVIAVAFATLASLAGVQGAGAQSKTDAPRAGASASPAAPATSAAASSAAAPVKGPPEDQDPTHLKPSEQAKPLQMPPKLDSGWVMDQCVQGRSGGAMYERPRAVVFAPAAAELVDKDWPYGGAAPSQDIADVFVARFPLDRFNNVVTRIAPDKGWLDADTITLEQMASYVSAAQLDRPFAGLQGDVQARAAREKEFVRYSLACTDFVFLSRVVPHNTQWGWEMPSALRDKSVARRPSRAPASLQQSPKAMYLPRLPMIGLDLAVFKREGTSFTRLRLFPSEPSPKGDRDTNEFGSNEAMPDYVSAMPEPSCSIPVAAEGRAGLSCRAGTADDYAVVHTTNDYSGPLCRERDYDNPDVWARCEIRDREEWIVGALQQKVKKMPEFRLYGPLMPGTLGPGTPIGAYEGVKKGMGFGYYGSNHDLMAYYKVVRTGPGGPNRGNKLSLLDARYGEAPELGKLEEIPLAGWTFGVFASTSAFGHSGATSIRTGNVLHAYALPSTLTGGGLSLAIDGSPAWLEWWVTLRLGGMYGDGQNTTIAGAQFDLATEKGFYIGERFKLVAEIGAAGFAGSVSLPGIGPSGGDKSAKYKVGGGMAALAFDVLINPYWSVRAGLEGRYYGKATYTGSDLPAAWTDRADKFHTLGTRVDLHYHF
ncbi:MAG: hypothetical protein HY898_24100 [Deltaproteobacteria bacterium]|nr:hypothetical protein [Deltaproteobacteria bacterium]